MLAIPMNLNLHYRTQLLVGLGLALWLYVFLVLIGPFDAADLTISIRTIIMLGYGVVFFLSYAALIPIQNRLHQAYGRWQLGHEIAVIALFCICSLPVSFAYYKTGIVNGTYSFSEFALTVYLPTITVIMPVLFAGRFLVARKSREELVTETPEEIVTLLGSNKLDILRLPLIDLIAMEAANNYVTVYYLLNGQLQKKLLRSSLRKMHDSVPDLLQAHRSYLVNPTHFVEWKDGQTLGLTQFSIPVSQKYKPALLALPAFVPK